MSAQALSLAIIIGAALVYIALERKFPYDAHQRFFRRGFWTDFVGYSIVQSYVLGLVISALIAWLDGTTGWSKLGLVSGWPLWVQCVFFFFVHDFYIYWFHRLQHWSKYLWRTHEAHHSVKDIDWVAGSRSHSVEILINQTIEFAPIVLLGGAPEVVVFKATIDAVWGMYIHSNIDVRAGVLQYVINGPEMHRWHHAPELGIPGKNFSTKLAIWDFLFGTAHYTPGVKPKEYGLGPGVEYPDTNYFLQHTAMFRPFEPEPKAEAPKPEGAHAPSG